MKRKGIFIVLVGPDGTGKTTIANALEKTLASSFNRVYRFHWRPGLLPALRGRPSKKRESATNMQQDPPPDTFKYGTLISLVRYLYYLTDFVLGHWLRIWPARLRGELVIGERWYYDVVVHPERYAFRLPGWLLKAGGKFVPRPDSSILLYGDPEKIHARKPELEPGEIRRHIDNLELLMPGAPWSKRVASDRPLEETLAELSDYLQTYLLPANRPRARSWTVFPTRNKPQILIGQDDTIRNALTLYQAHSRKAKLCKQLLCLLPETFGRYALPMAGATGWTAILDTLSDCLTNCPELFGSTTSAYTGSQCDNRKITLQFSKDCGPFAYSKCANTTAARSALINEHDALFRLNAEGTGNISIPRILCKTECGEYLVLVTSAPHVRSLRRSVNLCRQDIEFIAFMASRNWGSTDINGIIARLDCNSLANSLQREQPYAARIFLAALASLSYHLRNNPVQTHYGHGDYAAWNTLLLEQGSLYVFDWEYFAIDAPAFTDLLHFIYMPTRLVFKHDPIRAVISLLEFIDNKPDALPSTYSEIPANVRIYYIVLYLVGQFAREHREHGSVSAYTGACLEYLLTRTEDSRNRRKVLVSAYACEPDKGSEPGVGWNWVRQISIANEAWVITRENNRTAIDRALCADTGNHLHFEYVSVPRWLSFWKKGQRGVRTYYYLWQFFALLRARRLHGKIGFDIGHHVTFVNDWLWTFLSLMPVPYVWGPIGSHPWSPLCLLANKRAVLHERLRSTIQATMRLIDPLYWISGWRASRVVAINNQTANTVPLRWIAREQIIIEPAIGMDMLPHQSKSPTREDNLKVLFAGRFAPIKAPHLAVEGFAAFVSRYNGIASLHMIGEGPELGEITRRIDRLEIGDRVTINGWMPRDMVLRTMQEADIFLFPSMESAGMVVLEAMACGLPVVCLDYGGPGTVVNEECGIKIDISDCDVDRINAEIALALLHLSDPVRRGQASVASQKRVFECYQWTQKAKVIESLYRQCLHRANDR